jgi:hypothetical protein
MMKQRVIAMLPRIFAIVAVVVILGAALGAGSALAAKGGVKGKPGGNGNGNHGPAATLTVSPDPVACCGAVFSGSGSGYFPSSFAYVNIHTPRTLYATSVATDASGNMYFEHPTAEPGTYTVEVFQYKRKKLVLMATADLVVTE